MFRRTALIIAGVLVSGSVLAQDPVGTPTGSTRSASLLGTELPPAESLAVAGAAVVGAAVGLASDGDGGSSTSTSTATATAAP